MEKDDAIKYYPVHDYYRDCRHAFGTRLYFEEDNSKQGRRWGVILTALIVAAIAIVAKKVLSA